MPTHAYACALPKHWGCVYLHCRPPRRLEDGGGSPVREMVTELRQSCFLLFSGRVVAGFLVELGVVGLVTPAFEGLFAVLLAGQNVNNEVPEQSLCAGEVLFSMTGADRILFCSTCQAT